MIWRTTTPRHFLYIRRRRDWAVFRKKNLRVRYPERYHRQDFVLKMGVRKRPNGPWRYWVTDERLYYKRTLLDKYEAFVKKGNGRGIKKALGSSIRNKHLKLFTERSVDVTNIYVKAISKYLNVNDELGFNIFIEFNRFMNKYQSVYLRKNYDGRKKRRLSDYISIGPRRRKRPFEDDGADFLFFQKNISDGYAPQQNRRPKSLIEPYSIISAVQPEDMVEKRELMTHPELLSYNHHFWMEYLNDFIYPLFCLGILDIEELMINDYYTYSQKREWIPKIIFHSWFSLLMMEKGRYPSAWFIRDYIWELIKLTLNSQIAITELENRTLFTTSMIYDRHLLNKEIDLARTAYGYISTHINRGGDNQGYLFTRRYMRSYDERYYKFIAEFNKDYRSHFLKRYYWFIEEKRLQDYPLHSTRFYLKSIILGIDNKVLNRHLLAKIKTHIRQRYRGFGEVITVKEMFDKLIYLYIWLYLAGSFDEIIECTKEIKRYDILFEKIWGKTPLVDIHDDDIDLGHTIDIVIRSWPLFKYLGYMYFEELNYIETLPIQTMNFKVLIQQLQIVYKHYTPIMELEYGIV